MVADSNNNFPQAGNVPIYRQMPTIPLAWARVDEFLLDSILALGAWYISDMRDAVCPRTTLRDDSQCKRILPLSRAVVAIVRGVADGSLAGVRLTRQLVWNKATSLPPIRFKDKDSFNCECNNLIVGTQSLVGGARSPLKPPSHIFHQDLVRPLPVTPIDASVPQASYDDRSYDPVASSDFGANSETVASVRKILESESDDSKPSS